MYPTMYDEIFDRFLSKITDYDLAELIETEIQSELTKYLRSSISDFKYCTKDLKKRSDFDQRFDVALDDVEIEILAKFMVVHWINPQILRLENVRNELGNKDFRLYSPANFLDKISSLKSALYAEVNQDMIYYYYAQLG